MPVHERPGERHYVLLLRGVNVGAKNALPMLRLRSMLHDIGCTGVRTYLQSGNAVLGTTLAPVDLLSRVASELEAFMGRPIATTLRTLAQLRRIVKARPFEGMATNPARLCVTFLSARPTAAELSPLYSQNFGSEQFLVSGSEIYSWHPNGQADSPLAGALTKLKLRGGPTTRNWNTVERLLAMMQAPAADI